MQRRAVLIAIETANGQGTALDPTDAGRQVADLLQRNQPVLGHVHAESRRQVQHCELVFRDVAKGQ